MLNIIEDTSLAVRKSKSQINITHINDDCLAKILGMLKPLEQARLALTCPRFGGLFAAYVGPAYRKFKINCFTSWTGKEGYDFFRAVAPFIEEVEIILISIDRPTFLNALQPLFRFGSNIRIVKMNYALRYQKQISQTLFSYMRAVEQLDMTSCSLTDQDMLVLDNLPNLRILGLAGNNSLTGLHLAKLHQLEELYFDETNLKAEHFLDIAQQLKALRVLDVRQYTMTPADSIRLAQNCQNLETLRFSCRADHDISILATLPKLRALSVMRDAPLSFLAALVKHKSAQLDFLEIETSAYKLKEKVEFVAQFTQLKTFYWRGSIYFTDAHLRRLHTLKKLEKFAIEQMFKVTNTGLMSVLKNCENMQYMALSRCKKITEGFVFEAVDLLTERMAKLAKKQRKTFVLAIYETSININLIEGDLANSPILRLCVLS